MSQPSAYNDVFISYSRKDSVFARKFVDALYKDVKEVWVDWEDINFAEDWWERICKGIESASNFVFIITPDSIRSEVCHKEIQHAVDTGKRIVPILHRDIIDPEDQKQMHPAIQRHNWLPLRDNDDFEATLVKFLETIQTDPDHVRNHTRILTKAREWDDAERDASRLLSGAALNEAEHWQAQAAGKSPRITALHADFIFASHQHQRGQSARLIAGGSVLVAISLIAAIVASVFFFIARQNEIKAEANALEAQENAREASALASLAYTRNAEESGDFHVIYPLLLQANSLAEDNPLVLDLFMEINEELVLTGGFFISPDIEIAEDEYIYHSRTAFDTSGNTAAVVHRHEVQGFNETLNQWDYYVKTSVVSLWNLQTSDLIREIRIPMPTFELRENESFTYSAPLSIDADLQRAFILYDTQIYDDEGVAHVARSVLCLWNLETGDPVIDVNLNVDDLALAENESVTFQKLHYSLEHSWIVGQQFVENTVTGESRTIIHLWDLASETEFDAMEFSGEYEIALNEQFLYMFNRNTMTMTQVNLANQQIVHEVSLQELINVQITGLQSVDFVNGAGQAVFLIQHSGSQHDILVLELERLVARRTYTSFNAQQQEHIGDSISDMIYFPEMHSIFFYTESNGDEATFEQAQSSPEARRSYHLWNLQTGEDIKSEQLEAGEFLEHVEFDATTGWLLVVTVRENNVDEDDNPVTGFNLNLYDSNRNFSSVFGDTIDGLLTNYQFEGDVFWWIADEMLHRISPDNIRNCRDTKQRCAQTIETDIYGIPAGLSLIYFNPEQEFVILYNRNKNFFYRVSLTESVDGMELILPGNFTRLEQTNTLARLSNGHYVTVRYDSRNNAYVSFVWAIEDGIPAQQGTSYFFEELSSMTYNSSTFITVVDGGQGIAGLSIVDETGTLVSYLDVRFGAEPRLIDTENFVPTRMYLDSTETQAVAEGYSDENDLLNLRLLDLETFESVQWRSIQPEESPVWITFSPDGRYVAYAANFQDVTDNEDEQEVQTSAQFWIWNTETGEAVYNPRLADESVDFVFAQDSPLIYTLMRNGDIRVIDYERNEQYIAGTLNTSVNSNGGAMSISPDGRDIVIIDGNQFFLWSPSSGVGLPLTLFDEDETILSAVFINTDRVIFELEDRIVYWDVITSGHINQQVCETRFVPEAIDTVQQQAYELDATFLEVCAGQDE